MGCDIHMMAEIRRREKERADFIDDSTGEPYEEDKVWEESGAIFKNRYFDPERNSDFYKEFSDEPFGDRNYWLFTLLAGVRDYDVPGLKALKEPRGVPENASKEYKAKCWDYGDDGHSHSWYTLKELQAINFDELPQGTATKPWKEFRDTIHNLEVWAKKDNAKPDDVRIVFFFDN